MHHAGTTSHRRGAAQPRTTRAAVAKAVGSNSRAANGNGAKGSDPARGGSEDSSENISSCDHDSVHSDSDSDEPLQPIKDGRPGVLQVGEFQLNQALWFIKDKTSLTCWGSRIRSGDQAHAATLT